MLSWVMHCYNKSGLYTKCLWPNYNTSYLIGTCVCIKAVLILLVSLITKVAMETFWWLVCSLPFPAPAATPQTPSSNSINAIAIQVQWEPVPEIDQNGLIISYEVRVDPALFQNVSYMNVSGSELVLVVDGLEEFVVYNFTIRAYTIAGPGPFSVITTSTTDQAGEQSVCKSEKTLYLLKIFMHLIFPLELISPTWVCWINVIWKMFSCNLHFFFHTQRKKLANPRLGQFRSLCMIKEIVYDKCIVYDKRNWPIPD